ncbi:hypothetical protein BBJ28_00015866 [Nothophytophthora sp. Chile5]|nr:hypothetical protein BBJ28_00015866 [Nothophytophthora sp. Chile5]
MATSTTYGSITTDTKAAPRSGGCASAFKSLLKLILFTVIVAFIGLKFGLTVVLCLFLGLLVLAYAAVFAGFCYMARPYVRSIFEVPVAALRLQFAILSAVAAYALRGFKPLFPEWTLSYEICVRFLRFTFENYGEIIAVEHAAMLRAPYRELGKKRLPSSCLEHNTIPEVLQANGMEHQWIRDPEREKKAHRLVVIIYHGGGYAVADPLQHVDLANQTHTLLQQILQSEHQLDVSVDVLLANYRKAPEYPYPTPLNDCFDMYQYVLKHENILPSHVLLCGDSAGGEMAITSCMRLREVATPELQPLAAVCYSPLVDFKDRGNDEKQPFDLLSVKFTNRVLDSYLRTVTDPKERLLVSPIENSLRDLPPMFLQWGTLECFFDQGVRFKAKAEAEGVTNMEFVFMPNMAHDPSMFPPSLCPGAEIAIRHGCTFAAKQAARVLRVTTEPEPEN